MQTAPPLCAPLFLSSPLAQQHSQTDSVEYDIHDTCSCDTKCASPDDILSFVNSAEPRLMQTPPSESTGSRAVIDRIPRPLAAKGARILPSFVFDIDGVFKSGARYSKYGADTLLRVARARIPCVFMTNGGGGRTEEQYAAELKKKVCAAAEDVKTTPGDLAIDARQMVLSYTPFKSDFDHLKSHRVLIVGCPEALLVARHYGFKKAVHIEDYSRDNPLLNPFSLRSGHGKDGPPPSAEGKKMNRQDEGFKAVFIFTDPNDFFEALQILTDVLLSSRPSQVEYEKSHRIPVIFSAGDLLWKSQHAYPRFGQGAFRMTLETVYRARMESLNIPEREIKERLGSFIQYGKPETVQFSHARRAALRQAERLGCTISKFYMIGDNPSSDAAGTVAMDNVAQKKGQERWSAILVSTGIWSPGDDPMGAEDVFSHVGEAVDFILRRHNLQ